MVSTDAAARGIDIPNVTHVIQADFAASAVDFLHRVRAFKPLLQLPHQLKSVKSVCCPMHQMHLDGCMIGDGITMLQFVPSLTA